jgi:hypothetical protein
MTIFRFSLLLLALGGCSARSEQQQNEAIKSLNDRLSALEEAKETADQATEPTSAGALGPRVEDSVELAKRLGDEKDAAREKMLADFRIGEIDKRVKSLEYKDNQRETLEMGRALR